MRSAIRLRAGAREGIQARSDRVGIIGFSAGGHLASTQAPTSMPATRRLRM
jgi:acetyl esterase/lipase